MAAGVCYNFVTNHFTGRALATVIAGTGRFHGAKGTMMNRLTGYWPDQACTAMPMVETITIELDK